MALIPALAILVVITVLFTRSENTLGALVAIVSCTFPKYIEFGADKSNLGLATRRDGIPCEQNSRP
jgi:hypothetical protein